MGLNMVGFVGSSTSVADIYMHTKPQIEHDYLPHANVFRNKLSKCLSKELDSLIAAFHLYPLFNGYINN